MKHFYSFLLVSAFALILPLKSIAQCNIPIGMNAISITTVDAVLTWTPQAGVDTFKIRYAEAGTGNYSFRTILNNPSTSSILITGLFPGTTYDWQIKASCGIVPSAYCAVQNFTTVWGYMPCVKPFNTTTINVSNSSATLCWDTLVSADTFRIRIGVLGSGVFTWRNIPGVPNMMNYELTNLAPNTDYEWRVLTVCGSVLSSYSNQNTFKTTFGPSPCGKPYNIRVGDISNTSVRLNWSSSITGDQFRCRYAVNVANPVWQYKTVTGLPNVTNMVLTSLLPNTQYVFQVQTLCAGVTIGYGPQYYFSTFPMRLAQGNDITESEGVNQVLLYPNPASDEINVRFNSAKSSTYSIRIFDLIGKERLVYSGLAQMTGLVEKRIDLAKLPKGIYFAEVTTGAKVKQYRFVIDK